MGRCNEEKEILFVIEYRERSTTVSGGGPTTYPVIMDTERQQKIQQLCQEALARAAHGRSAYLAEACGNDDSLLTEVTLLLASHLQSRTFVEIPAHQAKIDLRIGGLQISLVIDACANVSSLQRGARQ